MILRIVKILLIAAAAVAIAALTVPYIPADRFAPSVEHGLEASLGREVDIHGKVRFQLLPLLGFSADDVVIHELPEYGVEPFAYVSSLNIAVRLTSLFSGPVELSAIRMVDPSINLMRSDTAGWNFQPLVDRALGQPAAQTRLPELSVEGGRINFKFGDVKSPLYLSGTDLTLEADTRDRIAIRFTGEPTRTDRQSSAFGLFSGRGWIEPGGEKGGQGDLNLSIERTAISEIATLAQGSPSSLGGFLASRARLRGPLSDMSIVGGIELEDIERLNWLFPDSAEWNLDLSGSFDLRGWNLRLQTLQPKSGSLPLAVRLRASEILARPTWGVVITARDLPFSSLQALAAETGADFPTALPLTGNLSGALGYSPEGGLDGQLTLGDGKIAVSDTESYPLTGAEMVIDGPTFHLLPSNVELGPGNALKVEARYSSKNHSSDVRLQSAGMGIDVFRKAWSRATGVPSFAALDICRTADWGGGTWEGSLRFVHEDEQPGSWTGDARLRGIGCRVNGLSAPVRLDSALLVLKGAALELRDFEGHVGDLPVSGSYSYTPVAGPEPGHPSRLRLRLGQVDAALIEDLLLPSLRRNQTLLGRTLGRTPPVPAWLASRRAEVDFQVEQLTVGGYVLGHARGSLLWNGPDLEVSDFAARLGEAQVNGLLRAHLGRLQPDYSAELEFNGVDWRSGDLDAEMHLRTGGLGATLLQNLRLDGSFNAIGVAMTPEETWREVGGSFVYNAAAGSRLELTGIHAAIGTENYLGEGSGSADGRVTIELAAVPNGQRQVRLAGRMAGLQVQFGTAP